jgi:hypothetical protein
MLIFFVSTHSKKEDKERVYRLLRAMPRFSGIYVGGKTRKQERKTLIKSSVKALLLEVKSHLHHSYFQIEN